MTKWQQTVIDVVLIFIGVAAVAIVQTNHIHAVGERMQLEMQRFQQSAEAADRRHRQAMQDMQKRYNLVAGDQAKGIDCAEPNPEQRRP